MDAANNSLDETIALATAANTIVQDPEKVGTTLKTVSMYLRSAKTEAEEAGEATDGMEDSVSKLRDELLFLTNNKVDIMSDSSTFKSTYQVLDELSTVWHELSDVTQANILEKIGGKRNANVVAALLENFSVAREALGVSADSSGSALAENEKVLESIQGRINVFKASYQELSNTVLNSDLVKTAVTFASNLLSLLDKLIDKFGGMSKAIVAIGGTIATLAVGASTKAFGKIVSYATDFVGFLKGNALAKGLTLIRDIGLEAHNSAQHFHSLVGESHAWATVMKEAADANDSNAEAVAQQLLAGKLAILTAALSAIVLVWQSYKQSQEEARREAIDAGNEAAESTQAIVELQSQYNNLSAEVKTNADAKTELANTGDQLVDKLGIEQSALAELTEQYGDYNKAVQQAAINKLKENQRDIDAGIAAQEDDALNGKNTKLGFKGLLNLKGGGTPYNITTGKVFPWQEWSEKDNEGFNALWRITGGWEENAGRLNFAWGKEINTIEDYLEAYDKLGEYMDYVSEQAGTDNAAYEALSAEYLQHKDTVDALRESYEKHNTAVAASQVYSDELSKNSLPTTQQEFEKWREEIVQSAEATGEYKGTLDDFKKALDDVLSQDERFKDFVNVAQQFDSENIKSAINRGASKFAGQEGHSQEEYASGFRQFFEAEGVTADDEIERWNAIVDGANSATEAIQKYMDESMDENPFSFLDMVGGGQIRDRINDLTSLFDDGKLTFKEYFTELRKELDSVDWSKFASESNSALTLMAQSFQDTANIVQGSFQDLIDDWESGSIDLTTFTDGFTAIADTVNSLSEQLEDHAEDWGTALDDASAGVIDSAQSTLQQGIDKINEMREANDALYQILSNTVTQVDSDKYQANIQQIASYFAGVVAQGGETANAVRARLGASEAEIANSLSGSVANCQFAADLMANETDGALKKVALGAGQLLEQIGNAVSNFKLSISIGLTNWQDAESWIMKKIGVPQSAEFVVEGGSEELGGVITNVGKALQDYGNSPAPIVTRDNYANTFGTVSGTENLPNPKSSSGNGADSAKDAAENAAEKAQEAAEKAHLEELKKGIEDVAGELEKMDKIVDSYQTVLDMTDEHDYSSKLGYYSEMLSITTDKSSKLYDEFNRLNGITPITADEAQELANRMESLGDEIVSNAKNIQEYANSLEMAKVDAIKYQIEGIDKQLEESEKVLDRGRNALTGHTLLGRNGAFSTSFLLPSIDDDAVEKKRKENEKILELEKWLQEEIYKVKKRYSDMSAAEAAEDAQKAATEAQEKAAKAAAKASGSTTSTSSTSTTSTTSTPKATQITAPVSTPTTTVGSIALTDATNYDALVSNMRTVLAARISEMVAQFTTSDWVRIVQEHPLTAFTLDEQSWAELQGQINGVLSTLSANPASGSQGKTATNVVEDASVSLSADMVNTDSSSWETMSESLRAYITQTYGLMETDWETLCVTYPLIAASLKLTGENSWQARNLELNGASGIVPSMMTTAQSIVGTTILPAAGYDVNAYTRLGQEMGNTISNSLQNTLGQLEITIDAKPVMSSTSLFGNSADNPQGIPGSGTTSGVIASARQYLGIPYVWGGTTPEGFDCSGLMQYVFRENGISLPRIADDQFRRTGGLQITSMESLRPGDMVFFGKGGYASHVGLYIGNGQMIHSPKPGDVVKTADIVNSSYYTSRFLGGKRLMAYAAGTRGAVGGSSLVGEEGRELAILPNGIVKLLGKHGAEIADVPKGTEIYPHDETEKILESMGPGIEGKQMPKYASGTVSAMDIAAYIKQKYPEITNAGIAAILGNIEQESSFNPRAKTIEAYGGGSSRQIARWGLFQLDDTRISNWSSIVNNGTWQDQVDRMLAESRYENSGMGNMSSHNVWKNVLTNPNLSAAAAAREFDRLYERSDGKSRDKRAANAERYLSQIEGGITGSSATLVAALGTNTDALDANTQKEKTITEKIDELTKTPSSYSEDFINGYMSYVNQRDRMQSISQQARIYGDDVEADALDDVLLMRDMQETSAMQLDLYTESAKAYEEQLENLKQLYEEEVAKGADVSVLSEIITAMSEVSSKIDDVSEKWQSALDDMGDAFSDVIKKATAQFEENISRAERNITTLNYITEVYRSPELKKHAYSDIVGENTKMARNSEQIMESVHRMAQFMRGEISSASISNDDRTNLKNYAAEQGQAMRQYYSPWLDQFGDYESWFNKNGTINFDIFNQALDTFDDELKGKATEFANYLSNYKIIWANDEAMQFTDIIEKYGKEAVETWFEGNGEITQAAWDTLEGITDFDEKNRFGLFLETMSAYKKSYYEWQEQDIDQLEEIYAGMQNIVDISKDALDSIRGFSDTLKEAAEEFDKTGYISIDSFEAIGEYGIQYMDFLRQENGQLKINKDIIDQIIVARTEELAIETAKQYVQELQMAAEAGRADELEAMAHAAQDVSDARRGMVYAMVAELDVANELKEAYVAQLDAWFSFADASEQGQLNNFDETLEKYDDQKQSLDDIIDLTMSLIKYEADERVKALNKQVERYQAIVDAQKESLSLAKDQDDYEKTVAEKLKEIGKLQKRIDALSLDDSRSSQAERKSLEEELAELQQDLADYQSDYTYDKTVEMLDKSAEQYQTSKDKEVEAVEESVSSEEKVYQMAIERLKGNWDTLYKQILDWNYKAGSSIESEIVEKWNDVTAAMEKSHQTFLDLYADMNNGDWYENATGSHFYHDDSHDSNGNLTFSNDTGVAGQHGSSGGSELFQGGSAGQSIQDIKDQMESNAVQWWAATDRDAQLKWEQRNQNLAKQLEQLTGEDIDTDNWGVWRYQSGTGKSVFDIDVEEAAREIVKHMSDNSQRWNKTNSQSARDEYERQNNMYASRLEELLGRAVDFNDDDGKWYIGGDELYRKYGYAFSTYHTGGIVGNKKSLKDNETLSVLQNGEMVLDNDKKSTLYEYIDLSSYILERFGAKVGNIGNFLRGRTHEIEQPGKNIGNGVYAVQRSEPSYVIESMSVTSPIQVVERLDRSEIKRHAQTIGAISAEYIQEGFTKRAIAGRTTKF